MAEKYRIAPCARCDPHDLSPAYVAVADTEDEVKERLANHIRAEHGPYAG